MITDGKKAASTAILNPSSDSIAHLFTRSILLNLTRFDDALGLWLSVFGISFVNVP